MKLLWIEKITQNKARVYSIHNFPEIVEDKTGGIVVDDILPKPQLKESEYAVHYINPQTKKQSYEICIREKTQEEKQQALNAKLLKDNAEIQIELNKQKELNSSLLLKIAQLGGNANA
ncbi:hypothetical protein FDF29_06615 [Clostridium botulinum]|uniref:Membrane protein n=1 Tax=Clostridium botulinum (strain Hall / ATCC 3502 / NCTC 13319 / Type A) TaxID=441771 RepID=A5I4A0_CLOBH|nr:hypothetical protein [Clostridium botulinum]NFL68485.1 hypothetical protein [Clostridium botulinum]NFQ52963.1 hypothetical protein [Clostridium botulinum]NFT45923.1 hypothetical protein [Clostridium botulinum]QGT41861.1 hypothetical protein GJ703_00038 [Clostridium botulinum]CAL83872.1 putative membrane protein [Clostridium botulinum A str. ATCC 3502]